MPIVSVDTLMEIQAREKQAVQAYGTELERDELAILADELDYMLSFYLRERDFHLVAKRTVNAVVRAAMIAKNVSKGLKFAGLSADDKQLGWRLATPLELLGQPTWERTPTAAGEADHIIGPNGRPLFLDPDRGLFALVFLALGNYGEPNAILYKFFKDTDEYPWLYIERHMRGPYGDLKLFMLPVALIYDAGSRSRLRTRIYYAKANVTDETFPIAILFASGYYLKAQVPQQLPEAP